MQELKSKTYAIFEGKHLYNRTRYFLVDKLKITCIGGDSLSEEEELVFIEPKKIPKTFRGKLGRNWNKLFDKIPKNRTLVMSEDIYGSSANIRGQVKSYNEVNDNVLEVTQRTDKETEETTVYVTRK